MELAVGAYRVLHAALPAAMNGCDVMNLSSMPGKEPPACGTTQCMEVKSMMVRDVFRSMNVRAVSEYSSTRPSG